MRVHVYEVTRMYEVEVVDTVSKREAIDQALARVRTGKVQAREPDTPCVALIAKEPAGPPATAQTVIQQLLSLEPALRVIVAAECRIPITGDPNTADWIAGVMRAASRSGRLADVVNAVRRVRAS